jgi:hypothetical protein
MPNIIDETSRDVLEQAGVDGNETPLAPEPAPSVEPTFADGESLPDAAGVEQGREPAASPVGGDAETNIDANEVTDGVSQPEEAPSEVQRRANPQTPEPTAQPPEASDLPEDTPQVDPDTSQLEDELDEDLMMKLTVGFQQIAPEEPFPLDPAETGAEKDSEECPAPKSNRPRVNSAGINPKERFAPKLNRTPVNGPRPRSESKKKAPEPTENDGSQTSKLCFDTIKKLGGQEQELSLEEREAMVQGCLNALLNEFHLHQEGTVVLVGMLYEADAEVYSKCVKPWIRRGLLVGAGVLDSTARSILNRISIARPCFIEDLGLCDSDDIAMLDAALAAYVQYLHLNIAVRRSNWNEPFCSIQRRGILARLNSSSEKSLQLYMATMKEFRNKKSKKDSEDSGRQRNSPNRSCRPAQAVERSADGGEILSEYEKANSAERLSSSSAKKTEVQS